MQHPVLPSNNCRTTDDSLGQGEGLPRRDFCYPSLHDGTLYGRGFISVSTSPDGRGLEYGPQTAGSALDRPSRTSAKYPCVKFSNGTEE